MREKFRTHLFDVAICVLVIVQLAQWWAIRPAKPATFGEIAAIGLIVFVGLRQWDAIAARRRATELAATENAAALERDRTLAGHVNGSADTITGGINATIVEIVAAQQAVVRGAYADDILTRLNAADESAHTALASIDQLRDPYPVRPSESLTTGAAQQ